jgi:hypothetical protein
VPQLRSPPDAAGTLTGAAGYYNLLPFAGLVSAAGAEGLVSLSAKYRLFQENDGFPIGLAVHSYFSVPIHKGIDFLLEHPVGTADLQFGFNGIVSKNIGTAQVHGNAGYRHISQPAHASVFRLADVVPIGFGLILPREGRIEFIIEVTAEDFIGRHTANTSFGPESPVDIAAGFRTQLARGLGFSAGYQRAVAHSDGNPNGFILSMTYNTP